jgi:hypothetical protein
MAPHEFNHSGVAYEVRFQRADNQWFATLYVEGQEQGWPLLPSPDELSVQLSDDAIRVGFIAVAEWLVKTERAGIATPTDDAQKAWARAA